MYIHEHTDGFRKIAVEEECGKKTGWRLGDGWEKIGELRPTLGQRANPVLEHKALYPLFSGVQVQTFCLDHVFRRIVALTATTPHHASHGHLKLEHALGAQPRDVTDWFWVAYIDAYDWVVEPNVLGMGTFATGDLMITKPYVSGRL